MESRVAEAETAKALCILLYIIHYGPFWTNSSVPRHPISGRGDPTMCAFLVMHDMLGINREIDKLPLKFAF